MNPLEGPMKFHKSSTNNTSSQSSAERLDALRPRETIPPRVIIHSLDWDTESKRESCNKSLDNIIQNNNED